MANYIGMNYNLDCVCYDAWDETTIMAFKADVIQFFTNEVLTSTQSRLAMFPQIGTNTISSVYRASQAGTNPNTFWQLYFYDIAGNYWRYEASSLNPTGYTFLNSGTHSWMANVGPRGEGWQLWFKNNNGVMMVDLNGNTGQYVAYGSGTQYYPTLPNTQVPNACWHNTATGVVYVSIVDTIYLLDTATTTVTSFAKYNVPPGPVIPPTPLPDIEVVYSAPSQFNLFASDVSLVTENQYGWNFTKTINDSNKMELYLYHSSAPGAVPFNYNQLRDIKINMKNNLVLPQGEIFVNVYTGPPVAPNWYNYKDTYNFTPPLGTTIDVALVEHILNLTDIRTDPILAIALHSNSAQQQVNCDVERVSFEILLPATNESQRVIVKLQNNFIALDNHYWDLDESATARLNTTIIPAFDIHSFSPNIVAGNFPQNATAKESTSGCALFVSGTWQLWETTDGTTWTATPNATITLIAHTSVTPTPPGPASNGFAYIGTEGMFDNYGTALPVANRPVVWEVTTSNQLQFTWTGSSATLLAPLVNMTTPNNFTAAQIASGFFDTNATPGGTAVRVFISSATSPSGEPVASRDIEIVVKSETEISIKRSWELSVTNYIINPNNPKEITGQYIDPAYTTSVAPTSFSMPTNWLETADNAEHFEILFSGGLNNRIPADVSGTYTMTVTPTPSNTTLTFAWTANYYTAGDVLISAVAGIGTSGLVSSFTVGGASLPSNTGYILYGCTSSENIDAFTSLVIIEPPVVPVVPFILTFQAPNNQISTDSIYSVSCIPIDPTTTYTYTAIFRSISGVSLGAVPGAGASGTSSAFSIVYANLPATVAYIDYNATATGGAQDGQTSQLSITIIEPCPPCPPIPDPGDIYGTIVSESSANIIQSNNSVDESHKRIDVKKLDNITLELTDIDGEIKYCSSNIYYELEFKINKSTSF